MNVFLFCIANQRQPDSILEDSINKPWRPLASHRLTPDDARRLLLLVIPIVLCTVLYLGGFNETLVLIALTWMYNDLHGANENYVVRNLLNASGTACFSSGAAKVATDYGQYELSPNASTWLGIVWAVIFSTLQVMDLEDMKGDAARGRRTMPLVHGERVTRWSIVMGVVCWSIVCPAFWTMELCGFGFSLMMGCFLVFRVLYCRGIRADKVNFKIWSLWTITLYLLPLCKNPKVFADLWG